MKKPCRACTTVATSPISLMPLHVVHPEHGKPRVFDIYSQAKCPDCGTLWHRATDNVVRIVG